MKYYVRTLKEVRTVVEYEIEAESLKEAKNLAWDLDEEDGNLLEDDCSDFEILDIHPIE